MKNLFISLPVAGELFKKGLMFKWLYCFWMAFLMTPSLLASAGMEEESMFLTCPEPYFACEWEEAYWGDAATVFWPALFPENPPFRYACMYLGSFDQEFGFYLDGDTLYWAHSVGAQSRQMLDQKPIVSLQTRKVERSVSLLASLWAPVVRSLLGGWDWVLKENPFHVFGKGEEKWYAPGFRDSVLIAAFWMESVINPYLYSRNHVRRGHAVLTPSLADALRQTWDESVAKRTYFMKTYRAFLHGTDGNYCYFRGGSGPVSEDLCWGGGNMRRSMMDLAHGLMDMMMMDDLTPEGERWLREQCARVRREASMTGDKAPPMVSDEWAQAFADRYMEYLDRQYKKDREERKECMTRKTEPVFSEPVEEEQPERPEPDRKAFIKGFKERFFQPLEKNPLWSDLFPRGTEEKPAALWFGERGVTGIYIDGPEMGRAYARHTNPRSMYGNHFFQGEPERKLYPYEGETAEDCEYTPRVKREWMSLGDQLSGLAVMILDRIAGGEIPAPNLSANPRAEEDSVIVVRGGDGTTRIISPRENGAHAVIKFLECVYASYEWWGTGESSSYLGEDYQELQGEKSTFESNPADVTSGIRGAAVYGESGSS